MILSVNDKVHLTIKNETFNARLIGQTDKSMMFERLKCDWSRFRYGGRMYLIYDTEIKRGEVEIKKHKI